MSYISYNAVSEIVKLKGTAFAMKMATNYLRNCLAALWRMADQMLATTSSNQKVPPASIINPKARSMEHQDEFQTSKNLFAIDADNDSTLVHLWIGKLIPSLPKILAPTLGKDYSASLIRRGLTKDSSQPCIQLQSPSAPSKLTKGQIREEINSILDANGHHSLPIHFSTGCMTLLTGSQSDDEGEDNEQDFPHQRRYWEHPGMGASIGLRCTRRVSATLGGYIVLDDRMHILTVDHFISKSQSNVDGPRVTSDDYVKVTSPSLSDVDNMRQDLDQTLRDFEVMCAKALRPHGDREITLSEIAAFRASEELNDGYDHIMTLRNELERADEDFNLGEIAHRCRSQFRFGHKGYAIRMDWAIGTVFDYRTGDNRHRTQGNQSQNENPLGDGEPCRETCDIRPNRRVHYIGSKSGFRSGEISAAPTLLSLNGIETVEWFMITQERLSKDMVAGDSGAWVIDSYTNQVVGLLYGLKNGLLFFTPIKDVFADIQDSLPGTVVRLPQGHPRPRPFHVITHGSNVPRLDLICEDKTYRKPKPYKWSTLPSLARRLSISEALPAELNLICDVKSKEPRKPKSYKWPTLPGLASRVGISSIRSTELSCDVKPTEPPEPKSYKWSTLSITQHKLSSEVETTCLSDKANEIPSIMECTEIQASPSTSGDLQSDLPSLTSSASSSPQQKFSSPMMHSSCQQISPRWPHVEPNISSHLDTFVGIRDDSEDEDYLSRRGLRHSHTFPRLKLNEGIHERPTDNDFKLSLECILHDFHQDHKILKHPDPHINNLRKSSTFPKSSLPDSTYQRTPIVVA